MTHYTTEQMAALSAYESEFRRAIDHNYARIPNRECLDLIRDAYMKAAGLRTYPRNWGCTACCIQLLKDAGRLYFADLDAQAAEAIAAANDKAAAEATKAAAETAKQSATGETPAKPEKASKSKPQAAKTE